MHKLNARNLLEKELVGWLSYSHKLNNKLSHKSVKPVSSKVKMQGNEFDRRLIGIKTGLRLSFLFWVFGEIFDYPSGSGQILHARFDAQRPIAC